MTPEKSDIAEWFDYPGDVSIVLADAHVVYACYETGCYEGDWLVIYVKGGKWYQASGSHCSCRGPDWEPKETTVESLLDDHKDQAAFKAITDFAAAITAPVQP